MTAPNAASRPERPPPAAIHADDRVRFEEQFRKAFRSIWLTAVGLVENRADADDVVQEAALLAAQKFDQFRADSNFTAWLAQFVRFVASNHRRKKRREARRMGATVAAESIELHGKPAPDGLPITFDGRLIDGQQHLSDEMVRALETLEPVSRSCLLLRSIAGVSYAEISAILAIPEGTAMSHVSRARSRLSAWLSAPSTAAEARQ